MLELVVNPAAVGPGCHCDQVLIQEKATLDLLLSLDVQNNHRKPTQHTVGTANVNGVLVTFFFFFFLNLCLSYFFSVIPSENVGGGRGEDCKVNHVLEGCDNVPSESDNHGPKIVHCVQY